MKPDFTKLIPLSRINAVLAFAVLSVLILYVGRPFLIPLAFAGLLALLLLPISRRLERWGIGRIWATFLCVLLFLLFIAVFLGVLYAQAASFAEDIPRLVKVFNQLQAQIEQRFDISSEEQLQFIKKKLATLLESSGRSISAFMGVLGTIITELVLIVLYLFFLLWKREKYKNFILKLTPAENKAAMADALGQISRVSARYLSGRIFSMAFLGIYYSIGLSIVGLDKAILMSMVAVLPTLIPYVGAFVGGFFPVLMALLTGTPDLLIPTVAVLVSAQVIDNNIIEPLVMGAELDLSPIFTIIAVVLGELIWGVPGMILFEPLFAVTRIICAHIPELSPYRYLLENELEEPGWVARLKKVFAR
ncbi:AI-2E family transporter [Spirosoma daeguense]